VIAILSHLREKRTCFVLFLATLVCTGMLVGLYFLIQTSLFLRWIVLPVVSREMGYEIEVKQISLSLAKGCFTVGGLQIKDGQSFVFSAETVTADMAVSSLLWGECELENALIRKAELEIHFSNEDASGKTAQDADDGSVPLSEKNLSLFGIRHGEIQNLTVRYQDESGEEPISFQTNRFALRIKNWGIDRVPCEIRGSAPFSLRIPGSFFLHGGRAELALNARFDGGALPREFSLSLGTGGLVLFAGEGKEISQTLMLKAGGSINRDGKVTLHSVSLQQHTAGEVTASILGSGSFGPEPESFSVRIRQFRTQPQFWFIVAPLFGYHEAGKVTFDGAGDWSIEKDAWNGNFAFSGTRDMGKNLPAFAFRCQGSAATDTKKQQTLLSALSVDVKETNGPGSLEVRLVRPAAYDWKTGFGGAVVSTSVQQFPLSVLHQWTTNPKAFSVQSGRCSGRLRTLIRKNLKDCSGSGMLSFADVILRAGEKDFAPLSGEVLTDLQGFTVKKLAGRILHGKRELVNFSVQGECGDTCENGTFRAKGKFNAEDLLRFYRHQALSSGTAVQSNFAIAGTGGKKAPLQLRAEVHNIPFRSIKLADGCEPKGGLLQVKFSLDRESLDEPGKFRLSVYGANLKFKQGRISHQWNRAAISGKGELRKDDSIRFSGLASAEGGKKKLFDLELEKVEYSPAKKMLDSSVLLRHCDFGALPLPANGIVTRGNASGKMKFAYTPSRWRAEGSFQLKNISGVAKISADGQGNLNLSGSKDTLELHSLSLDFQSRKRKILALTASGSLTAQKKGRLKVDSSMLDLDFLKRFCDDGSKNSRSPASELSDTPCRLDIHRQGAIDLNFRRVCIGRTDGSLSCQMEVSPGKILVRSYALAFKGAPIRGDALLRNAGKGVYCQLSTKVEQPLELYPVLQFFIPESLQGMRCQLDQMQLLCRGTLPQWERWAEFLQADLNAKFGHCVVPNAFGKGKIGRIILLPFEVVNKTSSKASVGDRSAAGSFWETLQGFERATRSIRFNRGKTEVKLRNGTLYVQKFQFKGNLVKDFTIGGNLQLIQEQLLNLQANIAISGMEFPVQIGGTLSNPQVQTGKTTTDIVVKNTGNLLNSLGTMVMDKVDWDTTLQ